MKKLFSVVTENEENKLTISKKAILIGVCLLVLITLIVIRFFWTNDVENPDKNFVSHAQVAKALTLLEHSIEECDEAPDLFDKNDDYWFGKYMNMMYKLNIYDEDVVRPTKKDATSPITYGEIFDMLDELRMKENVSILKELDEHKEKEKLKGEDWKNIYKIIVDYYNLSGYMNISLQTLTLAGTSTYTEDLDSFEAVTDYGKYTYEGLDLDYYIDTQIDTFIYNNEIIWVYDIRDEEVLYENIWINNGKDGEYEVYIYGVNRTINGNGITNSVNQKIADVRMSDKRVTKMSVKSDVITGKTMAITDDYIDISGYGQVKLKKGYRVYKNYQTFEEKNLNSVVLGYDVNSFVLENDEIVAVIIKAPISTNNIRVLIKTDGFVSNYHNEVLISCKGSYSIKYGEETQKLTAGSEILVNMTNKYIQDTRLIVTPDNENDKIYINSIKRNLSNPGYYGTIEVTKYNEGLIIINDLPVEKYLYGVVPSEIPASYNEEALKAQAICARSYAHIQIVNGSLGAYGAHVDDSTLFQVYNNSDESAATNKAVDDTNGLVMTYDNEVISAFFFSTSCGHTTDNSVWGGEKIKYLEGKLLTAGNADMNLSTEDSFYNFIRNSYNTYDEEYPWYRWNITFSLDKLTSIVNETIGKVYESRPNNVLTLNSEGEYISEKVNDIGNITKLKAVERTTGGAITKLQIEGTKKTVLVCLESTIRKVINPSGEPINKNDNSQNTSLSMLPSAFFFPMEIVEDSELKGYKLLGGGYGHGIGLSQNAANSMGKAGIKYEDILKKFYTGIEIINSSQIAK